MSLDCGPVCEDVFDRVEVSHLTRGGTTVYWSLKDDFSDPSPHTFQLEVGRTGNNDATDWEAVGLPVEDTYFAVDDEQRVYGKQQWTHYRVCLTTSEGLYISPPVFGLGTLDRRDWRLAREIIRKEKLRLRYGAGAEGYLLKRKHFGTKDTPALDFQTDEIINPESLASYGTGFTGGYFPPLPCIYADLQPVASHNERDNASFRGTIQDISVPARLLAAPQLFSHDVWVNKKTDERWIIRDIQSAADIRGIPIIVNVTMRLAPYGDVIYDYEIEGQTL